MGRETRRALAGFAIWACLGIGTTAVFVGCGAGGSASHRLDVLNTVGLREDWITLWWSPDGEPLATVQLPNSHWEVLRVELSRTQEVSHNDRGHQPVLATEGKFVAIQYRVRNDGKKPEDAFHRDRIKLRDPTTDRTWTPHGESYDYAPERSVYRDIQPGLRGTFWVMFEVALDVKELHLGFRDWRTYGSSEFAYVNLDLPAALKKLEQR